MRDLRNFSRYSLEFNIYPCFLVNHKVRLAGKLGLLSEAWRTVPSDSSVLIFASTHFLARPVGYDSGIIIMGFPMDATKLQETIDQAMKQAMINWTNSLASTTNYTVNGVDAGKIIHQFDYHTSQPIIF